MPRRPCGTSHPARDPAARAEERPQPQSTRDPARDTTRQARGRRLLGSTAEPRVRGGADPGVELREPDDLLRLRLVDHLFALRSPACLNQFLVLSPPERELL
jgi:hypothetical protein